MILLCKARRKLNEQSDYLNQLIQKTQEGSEGNARELTNATQDSTGLCRYQARFACLECKNVDFSRFLAVICVSVKKKISNNFGKNHLEASNPGCRCARIC